MHWSWVRGGAKLHASEIQPGKDDNDLSKPPRAADPAGPPKGAQIRMGRGQLNAQMVPLYSLAQMLAQQLGRPVLDKTNLKGFFDFKLEWAPDETQRGLGLGGGDSRESPPPVDSSGPSIFTALQEQLGLRLESQKGPVEILVIDHVEKASEN